MKMNRTKTGANKRNLIQRVVSGLLKNWRMRRMKIANVRLGLRGNEVSVIADVDDRAVVLHHEKVRGDSTLHLVTDTSIYMKRYKSH